MMYINTTEEKKENSYLSEIKFFWQYLKVSNKKKIPFIREKKSADMELEEYPRMRINKHHLKENLKRLLSMKL